MAPSGKLRVCPPLAHGRCLAGPTFVYHGDKYHSSLPFPDSLLPVTVGVIGPHLWSVLDGHQPKLTGKVFHPPSGLHSPKRQRLVFVSRERRIVLGLAAAVTHSPLSVSKNLPASCQELM